MEGTKNYLKKINQLVYAVDGFQEKKSSKDLIGFLKISVHCNRTRKWLEESKANERF